MENTNQNATITIDDKRYIISDLSDIAKSQVANIRFSDEKILQLQNELTISATARKGYLEALNGELTKSEEGCQHHGKNI